MPEIIASTISGCVHCLFALSTSPIDSLPPLSHRNTGQAYRPAKRRHACRFDDVSRLQFRLALARRDAYHAVAASVEHEEHPALAVLNGAAHRFGLRIVRADSLRRENGNGRQDGKCAFHGFMDYAILRTAAPY